MLTVSRVFTRLARLCGSKASRTAAPVLSPEKVFWDRLHQLARATSIEGLVHFLGVFEEQYGHAATARTGRAMAADGSPLPWFTYGAIQYLSQFDLSDKVVFEYGAGQSSLYFAARARQVVSVEYDPRWCADLKSRAPSNLRVLNARNEEDYVHAIRQAAPADLIVIDGSWRQKCAPAVIESLAPGGLVILDNSDWFPKTAESLRQADLIQVDFAGFGPVNYYPTTTSLFLRRDVKLYPRGARQPEAGWGSLPHLADDDANIPTDEESFPWAT